MKKQTLLLGAMLTAVSTLAAPVSLKVAPGMQPRPEASGAPEKSINEVKTLGTYMFGQTSIDCQHERAFVDFYSSTPHKLHKIANVWDTSDPVNNLLYMMHAGAHTPNGYYGILTQVFTLSTLPFAWIKVDPATGQYEMLRDLKASASYQWEGSVDMAYNPGDGQLWGVAADMDYDPQADAVRSVVGTLDMATGDFTMKHKLPYYYFALAFDYDGYPYGIRWKINPAESDQPLGAYLTKFGKDWTVRTEYELKPEGAAFPIYYLGTMDFDYTTGDLYWAGTNLDARQYLFKINPDNGDIQKLGGIGYNEQITGLYVPYITADHREAPARVNDLAFTPCTDGSRQVTLSWTNPSTQWNRKPLTNLGDVEIYRNDLMTPIAVVNNAVVGEAASYVDNNAPQGLHTYYVIPTNDKGLGVMDSIKAFVGRDVPGKVENLTPMASNGGKTVTLMWKKPTIGANDGWFDADNVTYDVVRLPDHKVIATDITKTNATDSNIEVVERYSYVVTAKTSDGEGTPTQSSEILAGEYVPLPYSTDFSNSLDAKRWTIADNNGDGKPFEYCNFYWPGGVNECFRLIFPDTGANDDDLISPPLNMEGGKTYKITYHLNFHEIGFEHAINFKGGTDLAALAKYDGTTYTTHPAHYDSNVPFTTYYTAQETAKTYVAVNIASKASTPPQFETVRVYAAEIEEELESDLYPVSFTSPLELVAEKESEASVIVHNNTNGNVAANTYKVQLCFGNNIVIGETSEVPAIGPREDATVKLTLKPTDAMTGSQEVYARVVLAGDQRTSNDNSDTREIEILAPNKEVINHEVTTEETGVSTTIPMAHYYAGWMSQTLYPAAEHKLAEKFAGQKPVISRLGWEYNLPSSTEEGAPKAEVLGTRLKVALGQTADTSYPSANWYAQRQVVYEGTVQFHEGTHFLVIDLKTPYEFDPSKSLIVTVQKDNDSMSGEWGPEFSIYGENWTSPAYWHSVRTKKSGTYGINDNPAAVMVPEAAKLLLAVKDVTSVGAVSFPNAIFYDRTLRAVRFTGLEVETLEIFDTTGRLVEKANVGGTDIFNVMLPAGAYIVRAVESNGNAQTGKFFIR